MRKGAKFSGDRRHRYVLWRIWDKTKPRIAFIGLNPSTADEVKNDPTVTRCIKFAERWGFGGMYMLNIFAFRATDPAVMKAVLDPIGHRNNRAIIKYARKSKLVVACWGTHGAFMNRGKHVKAIVTEWKDIHHLGLTKEKHPKHPLYLKSTTQPIKWN